MRKAWTDIFWIGVAFGGVALVAAMTAAHWQGFRVLP